MPVAYRRLLELQQLVENYGRGDEPVLNQIISLQVSNLNYNYIFKYIYCKICIDNLEIILFHVLFPFNMLDAKWYMYLYIVSKFVEII